MGLWGQVRALLHEIQHVSDTAVGKTTLASIYSTAYGSPVTALRKPCVQHSRPFLDCTVSIPQLPESTSVSVDNHTVARLHIAEWSSCREQGGILLW